MIFPRIPVHRLHFFDVVQAIFETVPTAYQPQNLLVTVNEGKGDQNAATTPKSSISIGVPCSINSTLNGTYHLPELTSFPELGNDLAPAEMIVSRESAVEFNTLSFPMPRCLSSGVTIFDLDSSEPYGSSARSFPSILLCPAT